ncbi:hypothetical protein KKG45_03250 [bacterium]|nr:hypothetical protein [bacterium]MBU1072242.1 hypothetical protein [bacterium]MBU1674346.1 hypothetical protein [bacterium]
MDETLNAAELANLVARVFRPQERDEGLAIIVDLPDERLPDNPDWAARRAMAAAWGDILAGAAAATGLDRVTVAWYRNAGGNNADLPDTCALAGGGAVLAHADDLAGHDASSFTDLFASHSLILAPTELSATAPLKVAVRAHEMRAATMPGFLPTMIPALRIDYTEVNRRVDLLKALLDVATAAVVKTRCGGREHVLRLDLRHNEAHASGGLFPANGTAGNLPSGETYIVPYEGNLPGDPSLSAGELPVQFDDEVVLYRIAGNRAVAVLSRGPHSEREARYIRDEPAYANLSELGLGVLGDFGLKPTGSILLDEKLGLHIAFGRSDHFGGSVGPGDFSSPDAVVHIDRVYIPEMQPDVAVASLTLESTAGAREIMRDGRWIGIF